MPMETLTLRLIHDQLADVSDAHLAALAEVERTRQARDDAIRDALDNGLAYRVVSRLTKLSRQQLTRIKDTAPLD
jgi:putative IMPACT (imprinted ancient) family translation regulator